MDPSTRDLVCLHLDAVDVKEPGGRVPEAVTVPGIADALGLGESVSGRVSLLADLEALVDAGLVRETVRSVDGTGTERNAYLLTDAGGDRAVELRERFGDRQATVTNGVTDEISLAELDRYFDVSPLARGLARMTDDRTIPIDGPSGAHVVGRGEELDRFERAFDALGTKGGHAVFVCGEAGVGKTTLVEEFVTRLREYDDPPVVAQGRVDPDEAQPYAVFREIATDLPDSSVIEGPLDEHSNSIADGPETAAAKRRALFDRIGEELSTLAGDRPVVCVLEDLQWADQPTVDLLESLIDDVGQWVYPVLFVGTYRSDTVGEESPIASLSETIRTADRHAYLTLDPLDEEGVRRIFEETLGAETLPDGFVDAVCQHTGGNPLFVTELARQFAGDGPVDVDPPQLQGRVADLSVPDTVEATIEKRLQELDAAGRSVLSLGAVIGETIPIDVLVEASRRPVPELLEYVDILVDSSIWSRTDDAVSFVHGAVRDVALGRLDDDRRAALHGRIAAAIESLYDESERPTKYSRLARHYREAGQLEAAIEASLAAARHARDVYAHEVAIDAATSALDLAERLDDAEAAAEARELLGETHTLRGEFDRAAACFEQAREGTDDPVRRQRIYRLEGEIAHKRGEFDVARDRLEQSHAIARDRGDEEGRAKYLQRRGFLELEAGEFDAARTSLRESLDVFREVGDRHNEARSLRNLGNLALREGEFSEARDRYRESVRIFRAVDDRHSEAKSLANLGLVERREGNFGTAKEYLEESLDLLEEFGDRYGQAINLNNLAELAQREGRFETAREYHQRSLDIEQEVGNRYGEGISLDNIGLIEQRLGNLERSREYHERGLDIRREVGDRQGEAIGLNNLGALTRREGNVDQARRYHEQALSIARDIGAQHSEAMALHGIGLVDRATGDIAASREAHREALDIFTELGDSEYRNRELGALAAAEIAAGEPEEGREKLDQALSDLRSVGAVAAALDLLRMHIAVELESGSRERAMELYGKARTILDERDGALAHQRERIESLVSSTER